jgi:hypothetical protein
MTDPRNTDRDERILTAAADLVRAGGLHALTREAIAQAAGMAAGSVSNFGQWSLSTTRLGLAGPVIPRVLDALMQRAVDTGDLELLAMGIAGAHPIARAAPDALRLAAIASATR